VISSNNGGAQHAHNLLRRTLEYTPEHILEVLDRFNMCATEGQNGYRIEPMSGRIGSEPAWMWRAMKRLSGLMLERRASVASEKKGKK